MSLTIKEAIQALLDGKKLFCIKGSNPDAYLMLKDGLIIDSEGRGILGFVSTDGYYSIMIQNDHIVNSDGQQIVELTNDNGIYYLYEEVMS